VRHSGWEVCGSPSGGTIFFVTPIRIFFLSERASSLSILFINLKMFKMKEKNQVSMEIINPKAAGIDIGSRSHFVAINLATIYS